MKLQVGDYVVCEGVRDGEAIYYGRIVAPDTKHEVRQCRTTGNVVVQTLFGVRMRRVTDPRLEVFRRMTHKELQGLKKTFLN